MGPGLRGKLAAALVPLAALCAGCGSGGATRFPPGEPPIAGGGGELAYALAPIPGPIDPLAAQTPAEQTVSVQLFEPLVSSLQGPYGQGRELRGLTLGTGHSGDRRVWSIHLRPGVRFEDGTPLNGSAVLVNVERWRTSPQGRRLLPGLLASSAPRPDLVRFIFEQPVADLPALLADPRLGLVSPAALDPSSGKDASVARTARAGSGPFRLSNRSGGEIVMARNRRWWGSRDGLGPALDRITFILAALPPRRAALLRGGRVRVAADLTRAEAQRLRRDPLLTAVGVGSGHAIGVERSVRGIRSWRPDPLNGVWLALVGQP
jgi:peptide/nickel transport system substrate-binding protein